jgi:dTDP-4-dehydrorhamnose reductase
MRILITGATGLLGLDVAQAAGGAHELLARSHEQLDILDAAAVRVCVGAERPEVVVNCAAFTDVDGAEDPQRAEIAMAVNGQGAGNVAAAAAAAGAWVLHISSDYVFDGSARRPYVESDRPRPLGVYGQSKLAGEVQVAALAPDCHTIVRSSWLFGAGGSCFPRTILSLARERESLRVVCDQIGSPTYTAHLARALIQMLDRKRGGPPLGVVHLAGSGQCSWFEFARAIVAEAGERCLIEPCTTEEFPRPAPRPPYSVLGSERADELPKMPDWQEGLHQYLATVGAVRR